MSDAEAMAKRVQAMVAGTLTDTLGVRILEASRDKVVCELEVRPGVMTTGGRLHGGAIMALADTTGAIGAYLALPENAVGTTTIESKTNFFAGASEGLVRAEATPLHVGGRTSCWQTRITDANGRMISLTTQTQMVLDKR